MGKAAEPGAGSHGLARRDGGDGRGTAGPDLPAASGEPGNAPPEIAAEAPDCWRTGLAAPAGADPGPRLLRHNERVIRLFWAATRGYRLRPWRSPYLRWRIETYCGWKAAEIGCSDFWRFLWAERRALWRYLRWARRMRRWLLK